MVTLVKGEVVNRNLNTAVVTIAKVLLEETLIKTLVVTVAVAAAPTVEIQTIIRPAVEAKTILAAPNNRVAAPIRAITTTPETIKHLQMLL